MIIQKGGRHMGKTAQAKLESFDALLDAYMELVEEKKKQAPSYKPKIVYIGMKYAKPKPKTNFDKIVSSVESLAEFFDKYFDCKCSGGFTECNPNLYCIDCFKEWLQKECDND